MLALFTSPVSAGELGPEYEGYEQVTFRVTLSGPVNPEHTFAVRQGCVEEICATEDIVIVCRPPSDVSGGLPPCSATNYEYSIHPRAGLTVEYALLRYTGPSGPDGFEVHLEGEWVVQPGTQTISLGYVYPGVSPLPDTALGEATLPSSGWPLLPLVVVAGALLLLIAVAGAPAVAARRKGSGALTY